MRGSDRAGAGGQRDERRWRENLILAASVCIAAASLVIAGFRFARAGPEYAAIPLFASAAALCTYFVLRKSGSVHLAGNWLFGVVFISIGTTHALTGGELLLPFMLAGVLPALSIVVLGRGWGSFWSFLWIAELTITGLAQAQGVSFPFEDLARSMGAQVTWLPIAVLLSIFFGLAYEELRQRNLDELDRARADALAATRDRQMFFNYATHELRTPVTAIAGLASLLEKRGPGELSEGAQADIALLASSANYLIALTTDLLDLEKLRAGKLEIEDVPIDPYAWVEDTVRLLEPQAAAAGVPLVLEVPDERPAMRGDVTRLRQIAMNLIANAIRFSRGERVDVSVGGDPRTGLVLRVRDRGIGIAKEHVDAVFETFEQAGSSTARQFGGTGLGLSITRLLVDRMGGEIELETELGRGSTFTVRLPWRI